MKKKSAAVFSSPTRTRVDRATGVIKGVVILQSGTDKHGDFFDAKSLEQLTLLGNAQQQGVKSRFGHPNACSEALGTYIGRYKNFTITDNADGLPVVTADLHLDPIAKTAPGKGDLFNYTLDMAETNSDMFGNSIVYNRDHAEEIQTTNALGETEIKQAERFVSFIASDVVDSPAATTNLFKSSEDFAATATEFLDEHPQIFELLTKNKGVVSEFLNRYNNYQTQKQNMKTESKSFAARLKDTIMGVIDAAQKSEDAGTEKAALAITLASGEVVTVMDEDNNGVPSIGDIVMDAAGAPIANASLELEDGSMMHTDAAGAITGIDAPASSEEPAMEETKSANATIAELKSEIEKLKSEREAEREATIAELENLKATLGKIKSTGEVPVGTQNFKALTKAQNANAVTEARERMRARK